MIRIGHFLEVEDEEEGEGVEGKEGGVCRAKTMEIA